MRIFRNLAGLFVMAGAASVAIAASADPYLWLEQVDSPRALQWVNAENAKTTAVLEKDPRYAGLYQDALKIAQSRDRIPAPAYLDGAIYNFWQDAQHVRGLWRRTTAEAYRSEDPKWSPVLDLDALASAEHANWVYHGADPSPDEKHVLLELSDGGEDAVTVREYDLRQAAFVNAGFNLPKGKQNLAWEDADTLLVAREWHKGELTASSYPYIVRRLQRGQALEQAQEIFRGQPSDIEVGPMELRDGAGHSAVLIQRGLTFFESEYYAVDKGQVRKLALPRKLSVHALVDGQVILTLAQDWSVGGRTLPQGSLVAFDWAQALRTPDDLKPELLYTPGPRENIESANAMAHSLLVTGYDNVRGRAFEFRRDAAGHWNRTRLDLPDNASIDVADTDLHGHRGYLSVTGFLTPSSLWEFNDSGLKRIKTLPPQFDAANDTVEQFEATSTDGTRVPYFVVHPTGMKLDGTHPTILYAYGGFQVSETPSYSGVRGKLWLEKGGVFVLANIRGGGEFGPAWHEAGLKTHRQRIYDDFASVARDLVSRGITSSRRLGIQGGSNGGLLMGVELTEHPQLWHAVDIQVPLLDMLRFEKIAAGASWVGEYGSVENPKEAAFLARISPYNNIHRDVKYPLPLIWTTTKDDRVGPQHARKFAARLSEYGIPYLFYEVTEGGHGAGANLSEKAHTSALEFTYFTQRLFD